MKADCLKVVILNLTAPRILESCFKILLFIFTLLYGDSKGLMKAFQAFTKPFEAPQRSLIIKIKVIFSFRPESGLEGLN